jgi:hypothetical protein
MPDGRPETLRRLSDYDLFRYVAGFHEGTAAHLAGTVELRRRENSTARWALGVSFASLVVSAISIALKIG